jgi:hypothetical protein
MAYVICTLHAKPLGVSKTCSAHQQVVNKKEQLEKSAGVEGENISNASNEHHKNDFFNYHPIP